MTTPLTVFYSWQSDLPDKTNRGLISDALDETCKSLSLELERSIRPDADVQGQSGAPDIASTILQKIENAAVFVADVSIIGKTSGGIARSVPNPNVMLELGYAKKAIGLERIIMISNTAYGRIEELPFDIRGRAITQYNYGGADGEKPAEALHELITKLKIGLGAALKTVVAQQAELESSRAAETAEAITDVRKKHFDAWRTESIAEILADPPLHLAGGPLVVLSVVPVESMEPDFEIDANTLRERIKIELNPLNGPGSWSWFPDERSIVAAAVASRAHEAMNYKRLFRNGAIQSVDAVLSRDLNSIAVEAVNELTRIAPAPRKLGFSGKCFISLDLLRSKGTQIEPRGILAHNPWVRPKPITIDSISPGGILVQILDPNDSAKLLRLSTWFSG